MKKPYCSEISPDKNAPILHLVRVGVGGALNSAHFVWGNIAFEHLPKVNLSGIFPPNLIYGYFIYINYTFW